MERLHDYKERLRVQEENDKGKSITEQSERLGKHKLKKGETGWPAVIRRRG